jgi:hypothetical protein
MMPKFKVRVTRSATYDVDVEADTHYEAERVALDAPVPAAWRKSVEDLDDIETRALCQVGEPWVSVIDYYMDSKDLLVFSTPFGRAFSKEDVTLLLARVAAWVGPVSEHWNGERCSTFSVRLVTPFGKLTDAQETSLTAPRLKALGAAATTRRRP